MTKRYLLCFTTLALVVLPVIAFAIPFGTGRVTSVTPMYSGCVSGPTGPFVQSWDVERGETYTVTISNVTECSGETINVRLNASLFDVSNYFDVVAYYVAPGVYAFDFYTANLACTLPVFYCTTSGSPSSGYLARRSDGGQYQVHLRMSYFEEGCTNPEPISTGDCGTIPVDASSWGAIKALYE